MRQEARRLLGSAAGSLQAGVVRRRGIVERVLLLSGMLLPCFVVLSGYPLHPPQWPGTVTVCPPLDEPLAEQVEWTAAFP